MDDSSAAYDEKARRQAPARRGDDEATARRVGWETGPVLNHLTTHVPRTR